MAEGETNRTVSLIATPTKFHNTCTTLRFVFKVSVGKKMENKIIRKSKDIKKY